MSLLKNVSLSKKLTVSAFLVTAMAMIFLTAAVYFSVISFGQKILSEALSEKTYFVKNAFLEPLWTYDQNLIKELGDSVLVSSQYVQTTALKIVDAQGLVLYEKNLSKKEETKKAIDDVDSQSIKIDLIKGHQKIGEIYLSMTNKGYIDAYRKQLLLILIISLVVLSFLSLFLKAYFEKTLTIPLTKILAQVKLIENENYEVVKHTGLPFELNLVSQALGHAGQIIEKRNLDIQNHNLDLERIVMERTQELEKQLEKNLNSSRMAAVGEMAAGVAHEINNPLTVIDLNLLKLKKMSVVNNDSNESMEELRQKFGTIAQSTEKIQLMVYRIAKIIKGLKSLSRDGDQDPMVPFMVSSMIDDVKVLVDMKLKDQSISFEVLSEEKDLRAVGREVQVSQVLVNLISNAIDAITDLNLSPNAKKWIQLKISENPHFIFFTVTDCGNGIPESILKNIMEPFFTTKAVSKGTGLGLSISRSIILEHGGTFEYNHQSPNTQFVFSLKKFLDDDSMSRGQSI